MLTWFVPATLALFIAAGTIGVVLPAIGFDPLVGKGQFALSGFAHALSLPGLWQASVLSLITSLAATAISLGIVIAFFAGAGRSRRIAERIVGPLLAIPHAAAAIGIAFLIAPSGWLLRLVSPWPSGYSRPPDFLMPNDPMGLAMTAGLIIKEIPFLFLVTLAALPLVQEKRRTMLASSLGYAPFTGWIKTVAPDIYMRIRLPVLAVLAYASSNVEVAIILGPTNPPTLSVMTLKLMNDPDLAVRPAASAVAILQIALTLIAIIIWLGIERLASTVWRRAVFSGHRGASLSVMAVLGKAGVFLTVITTCLVMIGLLLQSVTWQWRFPSSFPDSFSLSHWQRAWDTATLPISNSLLLALASSLIGLVLVLTVVSQAYRDDKNDIRGGWPTVLLFVPLLVPQIGFLSGLVVMFEQLGLRPGFMVVLVSHLITVIPYLYLALKDPFVRFDHRYTMIARSAGKRRLETLFMVQLPMLSHAVFAAVAIGFAVSIGQYLPTLLLGAGRIPTVTTEAVAFVSSGDRRVVGVWAVMQALLPAIVFVAAIGLPKMMWKNRAGMRHGRS